MKIDLAGAVLLISAFNALIFSFVLFAKPKKERNNKFIALLLLLCSFMIFDEFTRWTWDFFILYSEYTYFFTVSWFLIIPALYLLVRNQINNSGLKLIDMIHLTGLAMQLIIGRGLLESAEEKRTILKTYFISYEPHGAKIIFGLQIIIYLILIYKEINKKYKYSGFYLFGKMHSWLKSIYVLLFCYLVSIVVIILYVELHHSYLRWLDIGKTYVFVFVVYGWFLYFVYEPSSLKHPIKSPKIWLDRYSLRNISDTLNNLIDQILESKVHLRPGLKLDEIAIELKMSSRSLTDLVNSELGINTPQLMNLLRIKEMESMVSDPEYKNLTLMGLASQVGFQSKTSFYRNVKEFTGMSPPMYFKKYAQS